MKGLRFLLLGMAICLARGVKAQFYDSADDIYYYVLNKAEGVDKDGNIFNVKIDDYITVYVFNFDGVKAAQFTSTWGGDPIGYIKGNLSNNPNYYEEKVETTDYNWKYVSSSIDGVIYSSPVDKGSIYTFSKDRNTLIHKQRLGDNIFRTRIFKRVDKSYFKVGRSRTPSGTMHE